MKLRGATLIDGTGGDPVAHASVDVKGDRIAAVAGKAKGGGKDAVDLAGLTLLPGLIDAHTHFGLVDMTDNLAPAAVTAARIFRNCELALHAGFTTVRDVGGIDGGVAQAVELGLIDGPAHLPVGPVLCQTGGHGDDSPPRSTIRCTTTRPRASRADPARPRLRRARRGAHRGAQGVQRGATQIKVCVSGGVIVAHRPHRGRPVHRRGAEGGGGGGRRPRHLRHRPCPQRAGHPQRARGRASVLRARHASSTRRPPRAMAGCRAPTSCRPSRSCASSPRRRALGHPAERSCRAWPASKTPWPASLKLARDAGVVIGSGLGHPRPRAEPPRPRAGHPGRTRATRWRPSSSATATNARILRRPDDIGTSKPASGPTSSPSTAIRLPIPTCSTTPTASVVIKDGEVVKDLR